jgi:hypothetical protein
MNHLSSTTNRSDEETPACFSLRDEVAIEDFEEGSLVLLCEQLRLVQLNPTARDVVGQLDGQHSVRQVAQAVAAAHGQPLEPVLADLVELLADLERQGVVERCSEDVNRERGGRMGESKRYLVNPDVSCREEGPEGALLFNPDTDGTTVLNATGLLIWEALAEPRTGEQLVSCLMEACDEVPADQVGGDVDEFLRMLLPGGFVGEVLEEGAV